MSGPLGPVGWLPLRKLKTLSLDSVPNLLLPFIYAFERAAHRVTKRFERDEVPVAFREAVRVYF